MDREKLKLLPEKPGVYIFKDNSGIIIYIGKAKSLKNRAGSYFFNAKKDIKTIQLVEKIRDMDFIVTKTELEAFILENSLIKEHKPRYNILLKDDKTYPYITISIKEKYPGVYVTRAAKNKDDLYFGPYFAADAKKTVKIIYKMFKVRQCRYNLKKPFKRACVYYDAKVCSAPCVRRRSDEAYKKSVKEVIKFLKGGYPGVTNRLKGKMKKFSKEKKYEKAAEARDMIKAVKGIMEEQKVVDVKKGDFDTIDFVYESGAYYFCVLSVRAGRLINKKIDVFKNVPGDEGAEENYICQYYGKNYSAPIEVFIRDEGADKTAVKNYLMSEKGIKARLKKRGGLFSMARENINERIRQEKIMEEKKAGREKKNRVMMQSLQKTLEMKNPPVMVDAIDISHLSGENTAGSCVVFKEAEPEKRLYRRYRVRTAEKGDDYAAIKEVVKRRYSRMIKERQAPPDLIVIDGGKGQVNAAKEELEKLDIYPEIVGLAKKKEEVFKPYEKKPAAVMGEGLLFLKRVRDEAHRFGVSYMFSMAEKKLTASLFDGIPFIGDKTKDMIYSEFEDTGDLIKEIKAGGAKAKFLTARQKDSILKAMGKKERAI